MSEPDFKEISDKLTQSVYRALQEVYSDGITEGERRKDEDIRALDAEEREEIISECYGAFGRVWEKLRGGKINSGGLGHPNDYSASFTHKGKTYTGVGSTPIEAAMTCEQNFWLAQPKI